MIVPYRKFQLINTVHIHNHQATKEYKTSISTSNNDPTDVITCIKASNHGLRYEYDYCREYSGGMYVIFTIVGLKIKVPDALAGALQNFAAVLLLSAVGSELLPTLLQAKGVEENVYATEGFLSRHGCFDCTDMAMATVPLIFKKILVPNNAVPRPPQLCCVG